MPSPNTLYHLSYSTSSSCSRKLKTCYFQSSLHTDNIRIIMDRYDNKYCYFSLVLRYRYASTFGIPIMAGRYAHSHNFFKFPFLHLLIWNKLYVVINVTRL